MFVFVLCSKWITARSPCGTKESDTKQKRAFDWTIPVQYLDVIDGTIRGDL